MRDAQVSPRCLREGRDAGSAESRPNEQITSLQEDSAAAPPELWQLNIAIDVVASLAELACSNASRRDGELSISEVLEATFAHLVEYLHHLTINHDSPQTALSKAATITELTTQEMEVLRALARTGAQYEGQAT
jgi:hypothetical protein